MNRPRMISKRIPTKQRGVALLTAILLVALGTILATGIAFQNAMSARRGSATFAFDQSLIVAEAAEALAAYALRQDTREAANFDHGGESWAQPFGPVEVVPGVALEGRIDDLQGRFNINSLVDGQGVKVPIAVAQFQRLLEMVGLESKWANLLVDWIDRDTNPELVDGAEDNVYTGLDPPYRPPNRPVTSTTELLALPDFGRERFLKIAPYITALPQDAKVNLCTASEILLDSLVASTSGPTNTTTFKDTPELLQKNRETECFPQITRDYDPVLNGAGLSAPDIAAIKLNLSETSTYFRLTSIVTVGTTQFALYSLLYRDSTGQVRPIMRTFSAD